ncbi:Protein of unknown function [Saccharicrinis carchari]|uniref:DUF3124 domain-containing protein n=1 Tax=Saccharicrinis carchari TaxID=1168039 RepID=A0A521AJV6_SACCC|nr:DUF3124 domain-containing protein [Saccharicrinis carchari]SMO35048.1 Protein of unknown function [Saccharicrinis carchari]
MSIKKNNFPWLLLLGLILSTNACQLRESDSDSKKSHPSHIYNYSPISGSDLAYVQTDYVPVYSDIYHRDGTRRFSLTVTLSIRNTSRTDSAYILLANYHDSYGTHLYSYVDSTILLTPLEAIEFVVDEKQITGGAGANFIVKWGATKYADQLLIQTVMIGTSGQQGISFVTDAKKIEEQKVQLKK